MSGIYSQKFFDHVKESATNTHKTILKEYFKKQRNQLQLKLSMIKKYLKKNIYLPKKDINWFQINIITIFLENTQIQSQKYKTKNPVEKNG